MGYPYVSISFSKGTLLAQQSRYLASGKEGDDLTPWWVALSILGSSGTHAMVNLKAQSCNFELPHLADDEWVKVNYQETGFYRVKYDTAMMQSLQVAIAEGKLAAVDRMGIQNDAFALSKAGLLRTSNALALSRAYRDEKEYAVWNDLLSSLRSVLSVWKEEPLYDQLRKFVRDLISPLSSELGWQYTAEEADLTKLLRTLIINSLASTKDPETISHARKLFSAAHGDVALIPSDIRGTIYQAILSNGGLEEFKEFVELYNNQDSQEEKVRILRSLGSSEDEGTIRQALSFGLSQHVREQDTFYVIYSCTSSAKGRYVTWEWFKENFEYLNTRFGEGQFLMPRIVGICTSSFTTLQMAEEIEQFFKTHPCPSAHRSIQQSLESVRSRATWLERDREDVKSFLELLKH